MLPDRGHVRVSRILPASRGLLCASQTHRRGALALRDRGRPGRAAHRRDALVRGHVRAPWATVHRPADFPRHVQPGVSPRSRHERRRRHEHPLLLVAAWIRAVPVDGARAGRTHVVDAPGRLAGAEAPRGHLAALLCLVLVCLCAVYVHGHEVSPLYSSWRAATRHAHWARARRHARRPLRSGRKGAATVRHRNDGRRHPARARHLLDAVRFVSWNEAGRCSAKPIARHCHSSPRRGWWARGAGRVAGALGRLSTEDSGAGRPRAGALVANDGCALDRCGSPPRTGWEGPHHQAGERRPTGAIRLLHLFTYNYRRPWPDSLDFRHP